MYCKKCGRQVSDNSQFCPVCGQSMVKNNYQLKGISNGSSTVSFTMAMISAVIYIVGLLLHSSNASFYHDTDEAISVIITSAIACVVAIISVFLIVGIKVSGKKLNLLGLIGGLAAAAVFVASVITIIIYITYI